MRPLRTCRVVVRTGVGTFETIQCVPIVLSTNRRSWERVVAEGAVEGRLPRRPLYANEHGFGAVLEF